jgi:hypothetical protein
MSLHELLTSIGLELQGLQSSLDHVKDMQRRIGVQSSEGRKVVVIVDAALVEDGLKQIGEDRRSTGYWAVYTAKSEEAKYLEARGKTKP